MKAKQVELDFCGIAGCPKLTVEAEDGSVSVFDLSRAQLRDLRARSGAALSDWEEWDADRQTVMVWPLQRDAILAKFTHLHTGLLSAGWKLSDHVGYIRYQRERYKVEVEVSGGKHRVRVTVQVFWPMPGPVVVMAESNGDALTRAGLPDPMQQVMEYCSSGGIGTLLEASPHMQLDACGKLRFPTFQDFAFNPLTPDV